jgi:serine/threonine protein kinase
MHPRQFGHFTIIDLLPLGGMGRVYVARNTRTGEQVALKLIEHGPDPDRQEILAAERRGAVLQERLCRLDRRITKIRSYGDLDGFFFIEMEYVEGEDLAEVLRRGPLGALFGARIAKDLCQVLHLAHNCNTIIDGHEYRGVVHGDIKPRNVRITPHGEVRVLDFGIAKALSLTREFTRNHFASSQYSSPERLNTGEVDVASDLWSVGVVLYEVVSGRPYFQAETGPKLEHLIRNYRTARELPTTLPASLQSILRKALHPEEPQRYDTSEAFAADLDAFLQGRAPLAVLEQTGEDSERTRRTTSGAADAFDMPGDEERTRRTVPSPVVPQPASIRLAAVAGRALKPSTSRRARQVQALATAALVLICGALFWNVYSTWKRGSTLERQIRTQQLTDTDAAWQEYTQLARGTYMPVVLLGPRRAIQERLTSSADRTISNYRASETVVVRESDWRRARAALTRALELDPNDRSVRGKLSLADGHLARIQGTARGNRKLLHDARASFEEAGRLLSRSPDPHIGLARLYVVLGNLDAAEDSLRLAERNGFDFGRREKNELADAYRNRAEGWVREADGLTGLPGEKDYLERARRDFRRAQQLYNEVIPYGDSTNDLRRVHDFLDHVELRLEDARASL